MVTGSNNRRPIEFYRLKKSCNFWKFLEAVKSTRAVPKIAV